MVNKHGGGANTNKNGLLFEQDTNLAETMERAGCVLEEIPSSKKIKAYYIKNNHTNIGMIVQKSRLYSDFLIPNGIDYKKYISKRLLPDDAFVNFTNTTLYIIEKKFQNCSGSVDEKLQTCGFKKWEYEKLCAPIGYKVEYIYVCNDWFKQKEYDDVIKYIKQNNCHIFFNKLPINFLNIGI